MLKIRCRDAADGEAVPLMNVRHRQARTDDAWERRDIYRLFERLVLFDLRQKRLACIHDDVRAHTERLVLRNTVTIAIQMLEFESHAQMSRKTWATQRPSSSCTRS